MNRFLFLYPITSPGVNNQKIWYLSIETETHTENYKNIYRRAFLKVRVVFFCKFRCNSCTCTSRLYLLSLLTLTSLLNIFWAIHQELFFMSLLKKNCQIPKKIAVVKFFFFFCKVVGLQHRNLLKWNSTINVFLGIAEISRCNFEDSYYTESLEIIDKIYSSHLEMLRIYE